ncbi:MULTISPECIES: S8 family serine peptidase [Pseudoalteromonas]|uniref:S8 family serine peptidase n=1 Tax=Pseudoalteromonas TaxID=53246 RepID=UPI0011080D7B|nr:MULTISPECIES: S8 family serine peptidase [Pseudoalteromonas]MCG9760170.1 S8 family serine peptidase [Pseudoalteromonas sp. Isolate6]NKC21182.1 S8 family serine peptidase [Pseudoalteromonas galatheae]
MSTLNKSALTIAVLTALSSSTVTAATYDQYNFENKPSLQSQHPDLRNKQTRKSTQNVVTWLVKLNTPSIAEQNLAGVAAQNAISSIQQSQQSVEAAIASVSQSLQVVAKTSKLSNAIVVNGEESEVHKLLANPQVDSVLPVYDYKLTVADSADYIKATPLVASGEATGEGVRVAVLDTGIDYTHKAFGGAGTAAAYEAAASNPADTPAWPQGSVLGGYDFINNDPDPIDAGTNHGTHVSHSVTGIAPNVELFVYSVCDNDSCPGLAQLLALESAMDPNGDGDISDRVDVVNMSLGGDFGDNRAGAVQELIDKAVMLGTNVVISAGNDGPTPFIVGGPSTTDNALSVGAMEHSVIKGQQILATLMGETIEAGAASFNPEGFDEFEFDSTTTPLAFVETEKNDKGEATSVACDPFADDVDFTGKAVLVDRGACNFTQKVLNAQAKGAKLVMIINNVEGGGPTEPGGSAPGIEIPTIGLSYSQGKALKEQLLAGNNVAYNVSATVILKEGMIASFTSRGPSISGRLKPEITAPGVSIMTAHPGLGDGLTPASGTSFSGPITAGAMSMLKEALPNRNGFELKATLMNSANLDVTVEPRSQNPNAALAPISYIGSGLVDVEKAANLPVAAWAEDTMQAALSFGLVSLSETSSITKKVVVKNFSNQEQTYTLAYEQRFADDAERGALSMTYPESITIPAGQTISFEVTATIDPSKLPEWTLNSANMAFLDATHDLTTLELDGALNFMSGDEKALHLVYHVLPKAAANAQVMPVVDDKGARHVLTNTGAATLEPFFAPTVAKDEAGDSERLDIIGASVETLSVPASVCESGYMLFTTMITNQPIIHTYQGGFMADFDLPAKGETSPDGNYDVTVQNGKREWFGNFLSGSAITFTHPYGSASGSITNIHFASGNNFVTMSSCAGAFGLTAEQVATGVEAKIRFRTEEETWTPIPSNSLDEAFANSFMIKAPAMEAATTEAEGLAMLVDDAGNEVTELAPGESANLTFSDHDFMMLSSNGAVPVVVSPSEESKKAPIITADQAFSVEENTAVDTVIGQLEVEYASDFANPVSEFIVIASSSSAITVNSSGEVIVANSEQLDFDSGLESVELEVVATDTGGNVSEPTKIMVEVTNLMDEESEQPTPDPTPTPAPSNSSSGSLFWLLLAAPLALLRRRK